MYSGMESVFAAPTKVKFRMAAGTKVTKSLKLMKFSQILKRTSSWMVSGWQILSCDLSAQLTGDITSKHKVESEEALVKIDNIINWNPSDDTDENWNNRNVATSRKRRHYTKNLFD